jgi:hypothetical protein
MIAVRVMAYERGSSRSIATLTAMKADYSEVSKNRQSEGSEEPLHLRGPCYKVGVLRLRGASLREAPAPLNMTGFAYGTR